MGILSCSIVLTFISSPRSYSCYVRSKVETIRSRSAILKSCRQSYLLIYNFHYVGKGSICLGVSLVRWVTLSSKMNIVCNGMWCNELKVILRISCKINILPFMIVVVNILVIRMIKLYKIVFSGTNLCFESQNGFFLFHLFCIVEFSQGEL